MKTPELAVKMRRALKTAGKNKKGEHGGRGAGPCDIMNVMFLFIKSGMRSPQMIPLDVKSGK